MRQLRTSAIPLKSYEQGEYDRLYVLVTPALGKVVARSFGERRPGKLVAGHIQPWLLTELHLREKGAGWQILEAETVDSYGDGSSDQLVRLHVLAELVDRYAVPEAADRELWQAASLAREMVVAGEFDQLAFVEVLAKMAVAVGLAPHVSHCVMTGEQVVSGEPLGWSSLHGGLISLTAAGDAGAVYYQIQDETTVKLLRLVLSPDRIAGKLRVPSTVISEAEWLLLDYFQTQLSKSLQSLSAGLTISS